MKPMPMFKRLSLLLSALALLALAGCAAVQVQPVKAALPTDFPQQGFSHRAFEDLLQRFVVNQRVDYAAWHADAQALAQLDAYLAAVAAYSPENAPQRFPAKNDAKAYWLHVYNALVIKAVLEHWPLESVNDVKAPLEIVQGYGFFYRLGFIVGGKPYNLYDLEHEQVLKQWRDPRAHFVLNCASSSCPPIRPALPTGDALEPYLNQVTQEFLSDPHNVHVDHAKRQLLLSRIFKWYQADFINDLHRRGVPAQNGIVDYLIDAAPARLQAELRQAIPYTIEYVAYDWNINQAPAAR
jgi:hypothetical protein